MYKVNCANALQFGRKRLKATWPVLECIKVGYKLPLLKVPDEDDAQSTVDNHDFASEAIAELYQNCCIQKFNSRLQICSPLSVVSKSQGKKIGD